jgi:Tfp pilus assembly protein PilE
MVGVVILGIMVAIGIDMFKDQASSSNRDALSNDLVNYAASAQRYFRKPPHMSGGDHSFNGLRFRHLARQSTNANGQFVLTPEPASATDAFVTITATGVETGRDGTNPVQVQIAVWADSLYVQTLN